MNLQEFKAHILEFSESHEFNFGISDPFSWRGDYSEVAFSLLGSPMSRRDVLAKIELAYKQTFFGYKGGEYQFSDWTSVHFEESGSAYTDGEYCAEMIAKIEGGNVFKSQQERLVKLAFK